MSREAIIDQVAGILVRNEINYLTRDDGQGYLARFGPAGLYINFLDSEGRTVVVLSSPVVQDLELDDAARSRLLERLNDLNEKSLYVRAYIQGSSVQLECDLLGDELEGAELMSALGAIVRHAEDLDDELVPDYGGLTFAAKWDQQHPPEEPVET